MNKLIYSAILISSLGSEAQLPSNYQLENDWLIDNSSFKAKITETNEGVILDNGLVRRVINKRLGTTTEFTNLMTNEAIIRAITEEASVTINEQTYSLGGINRKGPSAQPNFAFNLPGWIDKLENTPNALTLKNVTIGQPKERLKWKKVRHHAPDVVWPPKGMAVHIEYGLNPKQTKAKLASQIDSNIARKTLFQDKLDGVAPDKSWTIIATKAEERANFANEGKAGEIYTRPNTYAFAERSIPAQTDIVEAEIFAGTDNSSAWGPGITLVYPKSKTTIKYYLRPNGNRAATLALYDGNKQRINISGNRKIELAKSYRLRIRTAGDRLYFDARPKGGEWFTATSITKPKEFPTLLRVGKTDSSGNATDHNAGGEMVRLKFSNIGIYGSLNEAELSKQTSDISDLKIVLHYELYDGIPAIMKWITVENTGKKSINIDRFTAEKLDLVEFGADVMQRTRNPLDNSTQLHVETDMSFKGFTHRNATQHNVRLVPDKSFGTQVNYHKNQACRLIVEPELGPDLTIPTGETFETFHTFLLAQSSTDRERKGLALRKFYRTVAPWVTENPIMLHCKSVNPKVIKTAIDQAQETGYEMVILSFGSGFDAENRNEDYMKKFKELNDYALSKKIHLGCYSLYEARTKGKENDIVPPKGRHNTFGNAPAITSKWGQGYIKQLYNLFDKTDFMVFENDGPYSGNIDITARPPLQKGMNDSRWVHWRIWSDFYKHLRGKGVFMNLPDYYYLSGANKCGMGYREANWALPRVEQRIHARQNIYDGTWEKTPSMGWMFVPLTSYKGGGAASTIEPLKDHIPHYRTMMLSNLALGVQACYRGTRIYDTAETKAMVTDTVAWFKRHRDILESNLIHGKRANGADIDWMLHVNPNLEEKALLAAFNPTDKAITQKIAVPLYYSGLTGNAQYSVNETQYSPVSIDKHNRAFIEITVPAGGFTSVTFKQ